MAQSTSSIRKSQSLFEALVGACIVLTDDGRTYAGMIASETGNSITLVEQGHKQHVILRKALEEIRSTGKSLMQGGLEKVMTHQNFSDLIACIRTKDSK